MFYLGDKGTGLRSFFLDADMAVTTDVRNWLALVRDKWRGSMREGDPSALSMTISGTPKVCALPSCVVPLSDVALADGKVAPSG